MRYSDYDLRPECYYGFSMNQLNKALDQEDLDSLHDFLRGQTVTWCAGDECVEPHGMVVFDDDFYRWAGR